MNDLVKIVSYMNDLVNILTCPLQVIYIGFLKLIHARTKSYVGLVSF